MKIERLLGILVYLLNRRTVTSTQLAEKFNVCSRTILRDLETLTMAGIPIYSEIGVRGGYSIHHDYRLNEKIIDDVIATYILIVLQNLKSVYRVAKIEETYEKIKYIYYANTSKIKNINIDFSVASENEEVVEKVIKLNKSIIDSQEVTFKYMNSNGENRIVNCDPIHISYREYTWYVFAFDLIKKEFLMFKIIRMNDLQVTTSFFENNYDVIQLLTDFEKRIDENNITLVIEYQKQISTLINEYFIGDIIEESDKLIRKSIIIKDNDFIMFSIILGFGDKIKVISPLSYVEKINNHLIRSLDH